MRFDKIIYIRYIPLTVKIYQDYYMEEAVKADLEVEYWDVSKLFFTSNYGQEDSSYLLPTKKFKNYHELEQAIRILKKRTLFISIMTFNGRVRRLYRLFTKYKCTLGIFGRNMFPLSPCKKHSLFHKILKFKYSTVKDVLQTRRLAIDIKFGKIKAHDIVFVGGNYGLQGAGYIAYKDLQNSEIIKINSNDYDIYLEMKDCERIFPGEYILFLDEYLPFHPDTKLLGLKAIDSDIYYANLNNYFNHIEQKFGIPVIIAAHPKALKYKENNYFEGRSVYFGKSVQLSKFASFVIAHDSTSINFPVAFNVKLHFITSEQLYKFRRDIHNDVVYFANYLKCNYQWCDYDEEIEVVKNVSFEHYQRYKYDFQTSIETEWKLTKDIFIEFICK